MIWIHLNSVKLQSSGFKFSLQHPQVLAVLASKAVGALEGRSLKLGLSNRIGARVRLECLNLQAWEAGQQALEMQKSTPSLSFKSVPGALKRVTMPLHHCPGNWWGSAGRSDHIYSSKPARTTLGLLSQAMYRISHEIRP